MNFPTAITVEWTLKRRNGAQARTVALDVAYQERIPRLARLMALAIKFDSLIRQGVVRDYADLARLGHVSRARITQIMNLLNLAPDLQETLLGLHRQDLNDTCPCERNLRNIALAVDWSTQRQRWRQLTEHYSST